MKLADDPPRHFSMMRSLQLADFLTLANAACGVGAVFCAMIFSSTDDGRYFAGAVAFAPAAFVFDVLDGRVARTGRDVDRRRGPSQGGSERAHDQPDRHAAGEVGLSWDG